MTDQPRRRTAKKFGLSAAPAAAPGGKSSQHRSPA
jgi:hypothetical protein